MTEVTTGRRGHGGIRSQAQLNLLEAIPLAQEEMRHWIRHLAVVIAHATGLAIGVNKLHRDMLFHPNFAGKKPVDICRGLLAILNRINHVRRGIAEVPGNENFFIGRMVPIRQAQALRQDLQGPHLANRYNQEVARNIIFAVGDFRNRRLCIPRGRITQHVATEGHAFQLATLYRTPHRRGQGFHRDILVVHRRHLFPVGRHLPLGATVHDGHVPLFANQLAGSSCAGSRTVYRGKSTTNDNHALAFQVANLVKIILFHEVQAGVFHSLIQTGKGKTGGFHGAYGDQHHIIRIDQVLHLFRIDRRIQLHLDATVDNGLHFGLHDIAWKAKLGNAHHQHAPEIVVHLVNGHLVPVALELTRGCQACRATAHNRDALTRGFFKPGS